MTAKTPKQPHAQADYSVAVVGAGFAGLCMAIQLKQAGIQNFVVFEKADDIGGTWRDNVYPGCACDVPSHLYSYSARQIRFRLPAPLRPTLAGCQPAPHQERCEKLPLEACRTGFGLPMNGRQRVRGEIS